MQAGNLVKKTKFYIDGVWQLAESEAVIEVVNPATDMAYAVIAAGSAADIDKAVQAARRAFPSWSDTPLSQRLDLIKSL